ncbi:ABC transporter permease [Convivina praedatoris]|uniref:ABC transporter permease n=1 Tax=Convivina praedatoris TaxID=2880963 RepID=A0ABM9D454_9LACO|nr:ABC transporter permease subunit [Convivina sp. LMG 32447]CAH1855786.1 hypothetical protein R077815_01277 [Convivina sp. LMG 32447]CAH1856710.1 hypothetical protein LMG032447_01353 [Convivina sp. LMG 32447]CAH1856794.1 hypothetical protein R078138_01430 [Convivina sp. LMG 32447]
MLTLLKQEFLKSWKQNRIYIWLLIAFIVPIAMIKINPTPVELLSFGGGSAVAYIGAIVMSALIFTQEFSFGTIRPLLSRSYSRGAVFLSKVIYYIAAYLVMLLVAFIATMIGKLIFANDIPAATMKLVWPAMGTYVVSSILDMAFVTALVLLVSNIVKSSGAAIGLGVLMMVGTSVLGALSSYLVSLWEPLKWNPLQLEQLINYYGRSGADLKTLNMISQQAFKTDMWVPLLVFGLYLLVIYVIAYLIFKRRSV